MTGRARRTRTTAGYAVTLVLFVACAAPATTPAASGSDAAAQWSAFKEWLKAAEPGLSSAVGPLINEPVTIKASRDLLQAAKAMLQYLDAHPPDDCYRDVQGSLHAALENFEAAGTAGVAGKTFYEILVDGYNQYRSAGNEVGAAEIACLGSPPTPAPRATLSPATTELYAPKTGTLSSRRS